jgi:uncharacterized protein YegL
MRHKVFNLIILDESGSMQSIKNYIIQGFNEVVQTIKGIETQFPEQEHFVSFVSFNGLGRKTLLWNVPAKDLQLIDSANYRPEANTPLFDAIGYCVTRLNTDLNETMNYNVLVTIITDGEENSSQEYNQYSIKRIIEALKEKRWTFSYIGTDHNVVQVATSISINNSIHFEKTSSGLKDIFAREKLSRFNYSQNIRDKKDTKDNYFE